MMASWKNFGRTSIRDRLIISIGLTVLLLFGAASWITYVQTQSTVEEFVYDSAKSEAEQNALVINNWLNAKADQLMALSKTPVFRETDWQVQQPILAEIAASQKDIEMMFIADTRGVAQYTTGGGDDLSDRDYLIQAQRTGKVAFSEPITSRATGKEVIALAQPLYAKNGSEIVGYVGVTVLLDYLQSLVTNMRMNGFGYGWIINQDMITVAHPNQIYVGNKEIFRGNRELENLAAQMVKETSGRGDYVLDGVSKELVYAAVPLTGWSVAMTADTSDIMAPAIRIRNISLAVSLIAIFIGGLVAFGISITIAKPIGQLRDQVQKVAEGNLTEQATVNSRDEIGQLAQAFNDMVGNLRTLVRRVIDAAGQLNEAAKELTASSEETSASASQTAATMNQIASTVQQVASNMQTVSSSSQAASENAALGNQNVDRITAQMNSIATSAKAVAESINGLNDKAQEIGEIIGMITGIADQTNLLALNAAIEAARAGEHGRGFAVVAEEVRKLAEQSAEATRQIQGLVTAIQAESSQAVDTMASGGREVEEGTTIVGTVADSFREIISAIQEVSAQFQEVSAAAEEMSSGVEQVSATSEEQTAAMEGVSASSDSLSKMAEELRALVDQFTV